MIASLRIRNLGVIEDTTLELGPGLTVLTGETGAGKTMVLSALRMIMGARTDAGLVRQGATVCDVEAIWQVRPADPAAFLARLDEIGAECEPLDDGVEIIATRSVAAGGKTKATVGGRAVPAGTLREITEPLVAVHGQADQWRLLHSAEQRAILDAFGVPDALLAEYRTAFTDWRATVAQLEQITGAAADRARRAEEFRFGIAQIDAVAPQPGEDAELDQRARVLGHAVTLMHDGTEARDALIGSDDDQHPADAMSATMAALRALDRIAAIDDGVAPVQQAVRDAQHALGEASTALEQYLSDIDADPARLQEAEERRRALTDLKRRYGPTLDDVLAWREMAAAELDLVDTHDEHVDRLREQIAAGAAQVRTLAADITTARTQAAEELAAAVSLEMQSLAMAGSQFIVDLDTADDLAEFTESGADRVVFTMIAHPGSPPRPLAKGASGGELARVMLALEVVLAGGSSVPTFVFDEVDAGVGGRAAVEVGKRLANLAAHAQVLVVTHLPQVAAFADHHVVVEKNTDGLITATGLRTVTEDARVAELVRMLSGLPDSEVGADHAREMLASAEVERVAARQSPRR